MIHPVGGRSAPHGVDIWRLDLDGHLVEGPLRVLDRRELDRSRRLTRQLDQRRYVSSHLQLRQVLASYLDVDPAAVAFDRSCERCGDPLHGRPRVAGQPGPHFSLSRSGGRGIVAVSESAQIGADIELVDQDLSLTQVARMALAADEMTSLLPPTPADARDVPGGEIRAFELAVLERWALKEACTKAIGTGLATDFSSLRMQQDPGPCSDDGAGWWRATPAGGAPSQEWRDMRGWARAENGSVVAIGGPFLRGPLRWFDTELARSGLA